MISITRNDIQTLLNLKCTNTFDLSDTLSDLNYCQTW